MCTVCAHDLSHEINVALVQSGASNRRIAAQHGLSEQAIRRHRAEHIPQLLLKAREAQELAEANELLSDIMRIRGSALSLLDKAERTHEWKAQVAAIREARENIRILAELQGRLATQGTTTIINNPEYLEMRAVIIHALSDFPEARLAVVGVLLDEGDPGVPGAGVVNNGGNGRNGSNGRH